MWGPKVSSANVKGVAPAAQRMMAVNAAASVATATASQAPQLTTTVWSVGGEPTEVFHLPASSPQPEIQLLVVPGNPGAASFYLPFMHNLHDQLRGRAAVVAVSNLGMDSQCLTARGRVFSLEQQIEHKLALLREHFVGATRPPVVILAHSIGAYMSVHAVHRLEQHLTGSSHALVRAADEAALSSWDQQHCDEHARAARQQEQAVEKSEKQEQRQVQNSDGPASNIVKVIGLYPFLQVDPSCGRQRRLAWLTQHHALLASLAGGLGRLPLSTRRGLVRLLARDLDPHAVDTVAQVFTTPSCVENGFYLGSTEFATLTAPADWWLLRQLGERFAVFLAPRDTWCKEWKVEAMRQQVPGVEHYWVETQTHGFCVSEKQSTDLGARIAPIVEAAVSGWSRGRPRL